MPVVSDNKFFSKLSNCFLVYHEELNFPYNRHTGIQNSKPFTESKTKCPIGYLKFRLFSFFLKVYAQNIKLKISKFKRKKCTAVTSPTLICLSPKTASSSEISLQNYAIWPTLIGLTRSRFFRNNFPATHDVISYHLHLIEK